MFVATTGIGQHFDQRFDRGRTGILQTGLRVTPSDWGWVQQFADECHEPIGVGRLLANGGQGGLGEFRAFRL